MNKERPKPNCCKKEKHQNKPGEYYCTVCNKWFCKSCIHEHNEYAEAHQIIQSTGFEISSICENENCFDKGISKYFCKDCNRQICEGCRQKHPIFHSEINYHFQ